MNGASRALTGIFRSTSLFMNVFSIPNTRESGIIHSIIAVIHRPNEF